MGLFRRTLFVCMVAGLGAASGCSDLPILQPSKECLSAPPTQSLGRPAPAALATGATCVAGELAGRNLHREPAFFR